MQEASLITSIFPERDNSCYLLLQETSDEGVLCKRPLDYRDGKPLPGLMTLKNYVEGGHEVKNAKVLLCVKSIGGRKKRESNVPHHFQKLRFPRSRHGILRCTYKADLRQ